MIYYKLLSSSAKTKSDIRLSNDPSNPQAPHDLSASSSTAPTITEPTGPSGPKIHLERGHDQSPVAIKSLSSSAKTESNITLSNGPENPQATQLLSEPKPETITTASSSSNQQAAASSTNTEPATTLPNGPSETETQLRIGLNVIQCFPIVKAFENDFKARKSIYQHIEGLDTHLTSKLQQLTGITITTPPDRNRAIQSLDEKKRRPFIQ